jgi:hypothetical protein
LNISNHTAEAHRVHAYQKLGVHNRAELCKHCVVPNVIGVRAPSRDPDLAEVFKRLESLASTLSNLVQLLLSSRRAA